MEGMGGAQDNICHWRRVNCACCGPDFQFSKMSAHVGFWHPRNLISRRGFWYKAAKMILQWCVRTLPQVVLIVFSWSFLVQHAVLRKGTLSLWVQWSTHFCHGHPRWWSVLRVTRMGKPKEFNMSRKQDDFVFCGRRVRVAPEALLVSQGFVGQPRPDLSYEVNRAAQRSSAPTIEDARALNAISLKAQRSSGTILRYPRGVIDLSTAQMLTYGNASFANMDCSKSQCGVIVFLTHEPGRFWHGEFHLGHLTSSTIKRVVRSTLAYSVSEAVVGAQWLRSFLAEMWPLCSVLASTILEDSGNGFSAPTVCDTLGFLQPSQSCQIRQGNWIGQAAQNCDSNAETSPLWSTRSDTCVWHKSHDARRRRDEGPDPSPFAPCCDERASLRYCGRQPCRFPQSLYQLSRWQLYLSWFDQQSRNMLKSGPSTRWTLWRAPCLKSISLFCSVSDFNIITVDHTKKMRTFEQHVLRMRPFLNYEPERCFNNSWVFFFILVLELQPCVTQSTWGRVGPFLCSTRTLELWFCWRRLCEPSSRRNRTVALAHDAKATATTRMRAWRGSCSTRKCFWNPGRRPFLVSTLPRSTCRQISGPWECFGKRTLSLWVQWSVSRIWHALQNHQVTAGRHCERV